MLVPGGLLAVLAVLLCWRGMPAWLFAVPPPANGMEQLHDRAFGGSSTPGSKRSSSAAAAPPASLASGAVAFMVTAALLARSSMRAEGRTSMQPPDSAIPRGERPKGEQNLPLGQHLQRFFSRRNRQFWNFAVTPRTYFNRKWLPKDRGYAAFFTIIHLGAFAAPFFFTWKAFACFWVGYLITGMFGITLSYHRQLAHRSFKTPKILEYIFAYCGVLALQSHPINWVSSHRHHHGGTETERDVHSPLDGFWWSHMGWLLDGEGTWMRQNKANAADLQAQWYYRFLAKTYPIHAIVLPAIGLYAFGGLPCLLWGFFARVAWVWHITWAVNSVSHVWGFKDWNTPDNSMNNWCVGVLAFGEGWHNNHHAFEKSCRHGLKWWQVDMTWYTVKLLNMVGLATDLQYPSETKMRRLSFAAAA